MAEGHTPDRPDLAQGIARADLSDGATLACDVDNEPVLLARARVKRYSPSDRSTRTTTGRSLAALR